MPLHDWQFWIVTLLALGGVWVLARLFMPKRKDAGVANDVNCPTCPGGTSKSRRRGRRVAITVERRRV